MTGENSVTIWHRDGDSYERRVFHGVSIYESEEIDKSGIKQVGFFSDDLCRVRIPSEKPLDIFCGDYLRIGDFDDSSPDKAKDYKITYKCDAIRGANPHSRLVCKR